MLQNNQIAQSLDTYKGNPECDAAAKRMLAQKVFLARIMKDCLFEYKDYDLKEIEACINGEPDISTIDIDVDRTNRIVGSDSADETLTEGNIYYDIKFSASVPNKEEKVKIIINVEIQNKSNPGYSLLKRGIYYCSRLISAQKTTVFEGSEYDKIRKVYSIWICNNVPEIEKNTLTLYSMKETNILGQVQRKVEDYDLLSVIFIGVGEIDDSLPPDSLEANIIGFLKLLFKNDWDVKTRKRLLKNKFAIPVTKKVEQEVATMCNISQSIYAAGEARGEAKGEAKGRLEEKAKSLKERIESIKRFIDLKVDYNTIAAGLGLSVDEVKRLASS